MAQYRITRAGYFTFLVFSVKQTTPVSVRRGVCTDDTSFSSILSQLRQSLAVIRGYMRKDCSKTFKSHESSLILWAKDKSK